jgi:UDPglucose 6-dehydrogenase
MKKATIGFAGLTHLGLNSLVASAERGFATVGFHEDDTLVQNLRNGVININEPHLLDFYQKNKNQISFSNDPNSLKECDIIYISTDVPTDNFGLSDLTSVNTLINNVIRNINSNAILVILCQVPPGFTRTIKWPINQLYYQVETLIFGRAIDRALNPERFIIGTSDKAKELPFNYLNYLEAFSCPILQMSFESAELAKISINMFLVSSVTTSNILAELCEKLGADWFDIIPALKLDKRIGPFAYLNPGLGIAGGNLERDLRTVLDFAKKYNTDANTVSSWIYNSKHRKNWVWNLLKDLLLNNQSENKPTFSILGLTYKENTHSLKNSASIELLAKLTDYAVKVYDPAAPSDFSLQNVIRVTKMEDTLNDADFLIIMTPWAEFKFLKTADLVKRMKGKIIIDPYKILAELDLVQNGFKYFTIGK